MRPIGILCAVAALWCGCTGTLDLGGSGGQTTNGFTIAVAYPDGKAGAQVAVRVRPGTYVTKLPFPEETVPGSIVNGFTDNRGVFTCGRLESGSYTIELNDSRGFAALLPFSPRDSTAPANLGTRPLQPVGTARGVMPGEVRFGQRWYVQILGLERMMPVDTATGAFFFNDLPAAMYDFRFVSDGIGTTPMIIDSIRITSGTEVGVPVYQQWSYSKRLYLNTTASGADVAETVTNFPILVRLTAANFVFSQAKNDGSDIRFTKSDGTPLDYEIERWDPVAQAAEVWVKTDTVYGNDSTHYMIMHWGNAAALSASNGAAVFNKAAGFEGVWHLDEAGDAAAADATINHFNGMPSGMTAASAVPGAIGIGRQFDGSSNYIQMVGTANSSLDFAENGVYSLSAWAYVDTLVFPFSLIASKGPFQYVLEVMDSTNWEFAECKNALSYGWDISKSPVSTKTWANIVGVRNGNRQYLYVNGACVDSVIEKFGTGVGRDSKYDFLIGKAADISGDYFNGIIDEVRIMSTAVNPYWVRLCYMNQQSPDRLIR